MSEWWIDLFDERYFRFHEMLATPVVATEEASFLARAMCLGPGATVLDLGCGQGRHSVALALLGHAVTGLDRSRFLLDRAADLARGHGAVVHWMERDMRDIAGLGPFDAAVCLHTAFGYFDDPQDREVVAALRSVLGPGGRLVLDLDNPFPLVKRMPMNVWKETPTQVTRESIRFDALTSRRVTSRVRFAAGGAAERMPTSSVRLYYPHEVEALLRGCGFGIDGLFGALADEPFDWRRSARMVWSARAV